MAELSAALEIESEHPLADAVIKFAAETLGHSTQTKGTEFHLQWHLSQQIQSLAAKMLEVAALSSCT